ncbi:MAG: methionine--tRNA ligase [Nitrospiraceae bacterium]
MKKTFYITTPIYYVNDVPHLGHAYTTIAADVLARYRRLVGDEVFFLTGLDEHGQKVQRAAAKAGIDPQTHCDRLAPQFQDLWKRLNISNDDFVRTTQPRHTRVVQRAMQALYDKGEIYQASYTGWYCTFDERFWTEKDLEKGLCPDCKRPVEQLSETNYFFRMSRYQDWLIQHLEQHPEFILPRSRRNEVLGFLQKPLEDLSISRPKARLSWGIELPFDSNYVTYVWFDALVNYISIPGYLSDDTRFHKWWPATVHLVGKDILTTHAVYWSTMLKALGLPLPDKIFAHGWWTVEGEKMSKSRGNVVDPNVLVQGFGVDAFRYFVLREVPFGQDGDFSREALIGRINTDLANDLGNLLSRTLTMIVRYAGGAIPEPATRSAHELDVQLEQTAVQATAAVGNFLGKLEFNRALEAIWTLVQLGNQYIDKTAPWTLAKRAEDKPRLNTVLYNIAETLRFLCVNLFAFMPQTADEIKRQLGLMVNFSKPVLAGEFTWGGLTPGTEVAKGSSLFPRIDTTTETQGDKAVTDMQQPSPLPQQTSPAVSPQSTPASETAQQITIEEFRKMQLRTAKVLTAERVPKSEKLIKVRVSLGAEELQIVAGIGKKYEPEALIGKTVVIVANLKPAKLMGVESQGMVLAAGDKEVLGLVTMLEEVEPGTKVK